MQEALRIPRLGARTQSNLRAWGDKLRGSASHCNSGGLRADRLTLSPPCRRPCVRIRLGEAYKNS
ncbi:hypothetical protein PoMZ_08962 [Pyricularia oryzae]|uniref:Uncharacterized protein n=1 Tax=Pyricularia oryzae TaxID=318829 RepID=A0A4P7MSL4_PYROR|nr:hypothetical protein PoMZ_08962 [Pyricularia oryzae]